VFTPEATLSGVARRSLSGQHASTPSAAAAEGPYQCVALGDPIMDLIGFERGNLLDDENFEKGGCVAVDHYDDILRLQVRVLNYAVRLFISAPSFGQSRKSPSPHHTIFFQQFLLPYAGQEQPCWSQTSLYPG